MKPNEHFGQQKVTHMIENNIWDVPYSNIIRIEQVEAKLWTFFEVSK
jgi:hypothetical protein